MFLRGLYKSTRELQVWCMSYLRLVSLCWRNWPSWLQALTRRLGSLSMWMMRFIASNNTAFLALECCTFLDLGGSWALLSIVSRHSVNLVFTAGSSVDTSTQLVQQFNKCFQSLWKLSKTTNSVGYFLYVDIINTQFVGKLINERVLKHKTNF